MADVPQVQPLLLCPQCTVEMRLFGMEESPVGDLFTFECAACGRIEARRVLLAAPYGAKRSKEQRHEGRRAATLH